MSYRSTLRYFAALAMLGMIIVLFLDQAVMPLYVRHGQVRFLPNIVGLPTLMPPDFCARPASGPPKRP